MPSGVLRARAAQLRAHAIGEPNGLGFHPPGPPSQSVGSPPGDALNAVGAAVDCAGRNFGHGPEMTWPLAGRLGLTRFLMPAPASWSPAAGSGHHHARTRVGDAHRRQLLHAATR